LNDFQRDLPLVPQPFAAWPPALARRGRGDRPPAPPAGCGPHRAGRRDLPAEYGGGLDAGGAAGAARRIDEVAALVGAEPGVNHSYLREGDWNLWFVATAPDARAIAASLARIEAATGLPVLSLPLLRAFNIDLGFPLDGPRRSMALDRPADLDGAAARRRGADAGAVLGPAA
jgi:hypothetical protein